MFVHLSIVLIFLSERPKLSHCLQHYIAGCQAARLGFLLSRCTGFIRYVLFTTSTGPLAATHFDTFSKSPIISAHNACTCNGNASNIANRASVGASAVMFYLVAYAFTNLAAFIVITIMANYAPDDEISGYVGLGQRSPALRPRRLGLRSQPAARQPPRSP